MVAFSVMSLVTLIHGTFWFFPFFFLSVFGPAGPSLLLWGLSVVAGSGVQVSHCGSFPCCRTQVLDGQAQYLCCWSLIAPRHGGCPLSRDRTRVSCTGRQILTRYATRNVPPQYFSYPSPQSLRVCPASRAIWLPKGTAPAASVARSLYDACVPQGRWANELSWTWTLFSLLCLFVYDKLSEDVWKANVWIARPYLIDLLHSPHCLSN